MTHPAAAVAAALAIALPATAQVGHDPTPTSAPVRSLEPLPMGAGARLGSTRLRHAAPVAGLALLPGKAVVSAGRDGRLAFWDPATGRELASHLPGEGSIGRPSVAADGSYLAFVTSEGNLYSLDLATPAPSSPVLRAAGAGLLVDVAPSGDRWAVGGGDAPVRWLDPASGEGLGYFELEAGHRIGAFELTAERLVLIGLNRSKSLGRADSADQADALVAWIDLATGEQEARFDLNGVLPMALAVDQRGERAFVGQNDGTIAVWHLETGVSEGVYPVARSACIALHPLGQNRFAVGLQDGAVRLWDFDEPLDEVEIRVTNHPVVAIAGDSSWLAIGDGTDVVLWNVEENRTTLALPRHRAPVSTVAFAPDGMTIATASYDGDVRLWDRAGKLLEHLTTSEADWIFAARFSPDGTTLLAASRSGQLHRWSLDPERRAVSALPAIRAHEAATTGIAFAPPSDEGRVVLATVSADSSLALWAQPIEEASARADGLRGTAPLVEALPGGKLWVTAASLALALRGAEDGAVVKELERLPAPATSLAVAPSGALIAVGLANREVHLIDPHGERETRVLRGHTGRVQAMAFSPDGATLASASTNDRAVLLWDLSTGETRRRLEQGVDVLALAYSPQGDLLVAGGLDGNALVWPLER